MPPGFVLGMLAVIISVQILFFGGAWLAWRLTDRAMSCYLAAQEAYFRRRILMTNLKHFPAGSSAPVLVTGTAVIACCHIVSFVDQFQKLFEGGGEMAGSTGLHSDARRLALVRMLHDAERHGANAVCNVRFETSTVFSGDGQTTYRDIELIAYGTAFRASQSSVTPG